MEYSPDYKIGFNAGYNRGRYDALKHDFDAKWILRKGNWYCSRCNTKNEQKHEDYCCKCGARMKTEDADYEDN